ncbi:hypothetical protein FB463_002505 [Frigoribacterium faeni]|uniref:Uncharacterized protein n=1 Tax=Frigoribacterium faeni TaxID=145483 RepID=A0A7W3JJX0_9MICO|nr:hypothetical protein [Frigoribacterium faeni]
MVAREDDGAGARDVATTEDAGPPEQPHERCEERATEECEHAPLCRTSHAPPGIRRRVTAEVTCTRRPASAGEVRRGQRVSPAKRIADEPRSLLCSPPWGTRRDDGHRGGRGGSEARPRDRGRPRHRAWRTDRRTPCGRCRRRRRA